MPITITNRAQLQQLARDLGVRKDWHEPDEQGVDAAVGGEFLDNAGGVADELTVVIYKDDKEVATVNLATLLAFATGTYEGF
jgi:hypothetical protein